MFSLQTFTPETMTMGFPKRIYIFNILHHLRPFNQSKSKVWKEKNPSSWGVNNLTKLIKILKIIQRVWITNKSPLSPTVSDTTIFFIPISNKEYSQRWLSLKTILGLWPKLFSQFFRASYSISRFLPGHRRLLQRFVSERWWLRTSSHFFSQFRLLDWMPEYPHVTLQLDHRLQDVKTWKNKFKFNSCVY